jgi:uncharacterized surface protein with fasciclin (FAS1) repeats
MKKVNISISRWLFRTSCAAMMTFAFASCSNLEDNDHYGNGSTVINNNELKIVNMSSAEYMNSRADLSDMSNLFKENGIYSELNKKGQLSTMLVVTNDNYRQPDADNVVFVTKSHVSDVSVSPANLHNGERLMMWHGKYVNVTMDEEGEQGAIVDHIKFNNASVKEVIQTTNGYIYVISDMIETPTSLSDFINSLDDNYSIFKDLVLSSGGKVFDRVNSKPIGVNNEGNTVYDTVWIYTNAHFEEKGFDMNSESLTATMLLFSNDVINAAMSEAHARLTMWGMERPDSALLNWIRDVSFYNRRYTADQLQNAEAEDIKSIFNKQWRTNAHSIDKENPIELSNGIVYNVNKVHMPNNLLMYRLKDKFYYYENCTDAQKEEYFKMTNMVFSKCNTDVAAWTPLSGVWPEVENRVLILSPGDDGPQGNLRLDFTPVRLKENIGGGTSVEPYLVPPGSYRLAMGFKQSQNMTIKVSVLVNGQVVSVSNPITLGSATTYHYDRGATLPDRYPEGYDPSKLSDKKAGNYDTDGGPIIDEVVIPDVNGDGSASQIVIRIEADNWNEQTGMSLHHWCLRPTVNNY